MSNFFRKAIFYVALFLIFSKSLSFSKTKKSVYSTTTTQDSVIWVYSRVNNHWSQEGTKIILGQVNKVTSLVITADSNTVIVGDRGVINTETNGYLFSTSGTTIVATADYVSDEKPQNLVAINAHITPATINPGDLITLAYTIKNTNTGQAISPLTIQYVLSDDITYNSTDVLLGTEFVSASSPGSGLARNVSLKIPASVSTGNKYILVITDGFNNGTYETFSKNIGQFTISIGSPDLVINTGSISPASVIQGGSFKINGNVGNNGKSVSSNIKLSCYLSSDQSYSSSDVDLGNTISLAPFQNTADLPEGTIVLPAKSIPGDYYVLLFIDSDDQIKESNEANNIKAIPLTITTAPAPVVKPSSLPTSVPSGQPISLSVIVDSPVEIASVSFTFYKTNDPASSVTENITVSSGKYSVAIPTSSFNETGIQYSFQATDIYGNASAKLTGQVTVDPKPTIDLAPLEFVITPTAVSQGQSISVSGKISNLGNTKSGAVTDVKFYISKDATYSVEDSLLNTTSIPMLSPSENLLITSTQLKISTGYNPGNYNILVLLDQSNAVIESDENNLKALPLTITSASAPVISAVSLPTSVLNDNSINLSVSVNTDIALKSVSITYWIITDSSASVKTNSLTKSGSDYSISIPVSYTNNKDIKYKFKATDANDNTGILTGQVVFVITGKADLIASGITLTKTTFSPGDTIYVSGQINNIGVFASSQSLIKYYLSSDSVYQSSDILISSAIDIPGIQPSQSFSISKVKLIIPKNLATGKFFILALVDPANGVDEDNENNNTNSVKVNIISPPPIITALSLPASIAKGDSASLKISVATSPSVPIASVIVNYRKITDSTNTVSQILYSGNGQYTLSIPAGFFDVVGVEYQFTATNVLGYSSTKSGAINISYPSGLPIPYTNFGAAESNYRMIAIPLNLQNTKTAAVMSNLGTYDKNKWRIFHSVKDKNIEYDNGNFDAGQGYWFIAKSAPSTPLNTGAGTTVAATIQSPYSITLDTGWNQIGNPYNMDLSWYQVKNYAKNNASKLISFYKYDGKYNTRDTLRSFEGAFVYASAPTVLYFPTEKPKSFMRIGTEANVVMSADDWQLPLKVKTENSEYDVAAIGMNPDADLSKDQFDDLTPPKFGEGLEINFYHPEYFYSNFTKDVVPSKSNHIWNCTIGSEDENLKTLSWDNTYFKENSKKLVLFDVESEKVVDMGKASSYQFQSSSNRAFRIFYGSPDFVQENLQPTQIALGKAYPNPFSSSTAIAVTLPPSLASYHLELSVYNSIGIKMASVAEGIFTPGYKEFSWDGTSEHGGKQAAGLYFFRLVVSGDGVKKEFSQKVFLK